MGAKLNIRPSVLFAVILAFLSVLALVIQLSGSLDPDVSWINFGAQRMLAGAKLYRDVVEINPPLIYYLSMPPFWLANLTGGPANLFYVLWVLLLATVSSITAFNLLASKQRSWANGYFGICVAHSVLTIGLIGESFGQREHYLFMLLAPYAYLQIARFDGMRISPILAVFVGSCAAAGIALKPHYILIVILLEVLAFWRKPAGYRQVFRPETIAGFLTSVGLFAVLQVFHPEFMASIVPLAAKAYLPIYRLDVSGILTLFGMLAMLIFIYSASARLMPASAAGQVLLTAAIASALAMLLQFRGFYYHLLLAYFFLLVYSGYWALQSGQSQFWWRNVLSVGVMACLFFFNKPYAYRPYYPDDRQIPKGTSVVVFSTSVGAGFPWTSNEGLIWTSRFPCLWFFPYIAMVDHAVEAHITTDHDAIELANELRRQTVDDLLANRPEVIVVKTYPHPTDSSQPDYFAVLGKDPRFAQFFERYELKRKVEDLEFYSRGQTY